MEKTKIFIGRCVLGKYPDQVDVGFTKEDLDKLFAHLNQKGWVNARLNKGRDSGKPYMEIIPSSNELQTSGMTREASQHQSYQAPKPKDDFLQSDLQGTDDLPF